MNELNKQSLLEFLDWAGEKGLMKKANAQNMKVACKALLDVLEESESGDLSKLNLDSVFQRYENLNSLNAKPETMKVYRRRLRSAIGEFISYNNDPTNWRPSAGQRTNSSHKVTKQKKERPSDMRGDVPNERGIDGILGDVSKITHRFPLRQDVIVSITGIPFDVTRHEMGRLTAYVSNLVAGSVEDESAKPMLNAAAADA